jgi:hypothetical protein
MVVHNGNEINRLAAARARAKTFAAYPPEVFEEPGWGIAETPRWYVINPGWVLCSQSWRKRGGFVLQAAFAGV